MKTITCLPSISPQAWLCTPPAATGAVLSSTLYSLTWGEISRDLPVEIYLASTASRVPRGTHEVGRGCGRLTRLCRGAPTKWVVGDVSPLDSLTGRKAHIEAFEVKLDLGRRRELIQNLSGYVGIAKEAFACYCEAQQHEVCQRGSTGAEGEAGGIY
jgi:hypothetical protein